MDFLGKSPQKAALRATKVVCNMDFLKVHSLKNVIVLLVRTS